MSYFYTHFTREKSKILVRGYKDGKRFNRTVKYKPSLYIKATKDSVDTGFRSIDRVPLREIGFESIFEAGTFTRSYKDVQGFDIYGYPNFEYSYINEEFKDMVSDNSLVKIGNWDIETDSEDGFGNIEYADKAIITISIKVLGTNKVFAFGTKPYSSTRFAGEESKYEIVYKQCKDEREMLIWFVTTWKHLDFDAQTGWNINGYDIPYMIRRINLILGEEWSVKLSPWGLIRTTEILMFGQTRTLFEIVGIPTLDYMEVYKKFSFGNEESYKLEYISTKVLGTGKLDYSEHKTLARLYKADYNKFMDYNIIDILRIDDLEAFLKFIDQIITMAHSCGVNFTDTFTTVRIWDVMITNYLMTSKIIVPYSSQNKEDRAIAGGHVKDVIPGPYNWVLSFDLTSLYPMIIKMYNISPEKFKGQLPELANPEESVDKILNGAVDQFREKLVKHNLCVTGKGTVFSKEGTGFIPGIMTRLFNLRKVYKRQMLDAKQVVSDIDAEIKRREAA